MSKDKKLKAIANEISAAWARVVQTQREQANLIAEAIEVGCPKQELAAALRWSEKRLDAYLKWRADGYPEAMVENLLWSD
jgi:hypothetical protein